MKQEVFLEIRRFVAPGRASCVQHEIVTNNASKS